MSDRQVYFIKPVGVPGPIKIGCTRFLKDRIYNMTLWSPVPLEVLVVVPGTFKTEKALHHHFAAHRLHHEWFEPVPELVALVSALMAGKSLDDVVSLTTRESRRRTTKREAA